MAKVKVYGASDDLVEVEGDIREEFSCYDTPCVLLFSDGTKIRVEHCPDHHPNGWSIVLEDLSEFGSTVMIEDATDPNEPEYVCQEAIVEGPFTWIWQAVDIDEALKQIGDNLEKMTDSLSEEEILDLHKRMFLLELSTPAENSMEG